MSLPSSTFYTYRTPYGPLTIQASPQGIARIELKRAFLTGKHEPSALSNQAANELLEYFAGKRVTFDVLLDLQGTEFQKLVWHELGNIPYGASCSTTDIAQRIGKQKSYRAVGQAIKKNPLPIIIPDHRITGSNDMPLGADSTARLRGALLTMERAQAT